MRLLCGGKQEEAEALLQNVCSSASMTADDKVMLLAWLLELRVQELCASRDKQRFDACHLVAKELQECLRGKEIYMFKRPDGGSVLRFRHAYWIGKLSELWGDMESAVKLYSASVVAAERGGGSRLRSSASAAQACYSLGERLFTCRHFYPALKHVSRALDFAHSCNLTPMIVKASVLGYKLHLAIAAGYGSGVDSAAASTSNAADANSNAIANRNRNNVQALQMIVLGLKQLRTNLPTEISVQKAESLVRACKNLLDKVVPLYPPVFSTPGVGSSKPGFVYEAERVMTDVSLVCAGARAKAHTSCMRIGLNYLLQSTKNIERVVHVATRAESAKEEEHARKKRKVETSDGQVQTDNCDFTPAGDTLTVKPEPED